MPVIDKSSAIATITAKLKKLDSGSYLEMLTYKKDRSVIIIKKTEDTYQIQEKGFFQDEFTVQGLKLKKILKGLLKKEFPRSNKIRVQCGKAGD